MKLERVSLVRIGVKILPLQLINIRQVTTQWMDSLTVDLDVKNYPIFTLRRKIWVTKLSRG